MGGIKIQDLRFKKKGLSDTYLIVKVLSPGMITEILKDYGDYRII